jgi:hypothetical protein
MLQEQSVNVVTVDSTMDETSVGPYYATPNLITSANNVMMAEAYVVAMIMPQDAKEDEEYNDDISMC